MYTKPKFTTSQVLIWTAPELAIFMLYNIVIVYLFQVMGFRFLALPWAPVAVLGTALAFILGFRNNASYGRLWEARKIWGGIVNSSRSWGMQTEVMISPEPDAAPISSGELQEIRRVLVYRHIAWMTALRYAMRTPKTWEVFANSRGYAKFSQEFQIPELNTPFEEAISPYLSKEENAYVLSKSNKQTALLYMQSRHLKELKDRKLMDRFAFLELQSILEELFTLQGKSERIKNFPYPRQYATVSQEFLRIFWVLLPFAALPGFVEIGSTFGDPWTWFSGDFVWVSVPFCALVSWVYNILEKIGKFGEHPFEGTVNDVPISSIARGIEINLRQMLDEDQDAIPGPFTQVRNVQM